MEATIANKAPAQERMQYKTQGVLGEGAFGMVTKLQLVDPAHNGQVRGCVRGSLSPPQIVALKTVLQDPKYKARPIRSRCDSLTHAQNRELDIMQVVSHPCVTVLNWFFYTVKEAGPLAPRPPAHAPQTHTFLNLMKEYLPENLGSYLSVQRRAKKVLPLALIKATACCTSILR